MMRTLAETGNGWMTFKDASNEQVQPDRHRRRRRHPERGAPVQPVHRDPRGHQPGRDRGLQPRLDQPRRHGPPDAAGALAFDFDRLAEVVRPAVPFLDRVIDINYYPTDAAGNSNAKWRPVGLGVMGLQDVFFQLRLPFDSAEARALSTRISEEIYFHALTASSELAERARPARRLGRDPRGQGRAAVRPVGRHARPTRSAGTALRARIAEHGLRNSLLIAIAPTATIASIAGCYECIEPQVSNLFKRETLSGEFLQINAYLVRELQALGLWTEPVIAAIKRDEGSVQDIEEIPEDDPRDLPHGVGAPACGR